jgi:hypothetical protein
VFNVDHYLLSSLKRQQIRWSYRSSLQPDGREKLSLVYVRCALQHYACASSLCGYGAEDSGSLAQPLHVRATYAGLITTSHTDWCSTNRHSASHARIYSSNIAPTIPRSDCRIGIVGCARGRATMTRSSYIRLGFHDALDPVHILDVENPSSQQIALSLHCMA